MKNPFVFGGPVPPSDFFGRRDSVQFIMDRLYGRSRSSVGLWGDRRVGKSSLLYYLTQSGLREPWVDAPQKHHILFIDCQMFAAQFDPQLFWQEVLEQAADLIVAPDVQTYVNELLDNLPIQERALRRFLRQLHSAGETLTLLLDEFSHIIWAGQIHDKREVHGFLAFLRTALTAVMPPPHSPYPRPLALVTSTRRPLHEVCRPIYHNDAGSPFYNPFVSERLQPFTEANVHDLLDTKLAGTDIEFSPDERAHLLATAGRHPILVQGYAGEMFIAEQKQPREIINFTPIDSRFYDRSSSHFYDFWQYSSEEEQHFLITLMQQQLEWQLLSSREENARRQLIDRGLLNATNQLFSPLFGEWLRLNLPQLEQERAQAEPLPDGSMLREIIDKLFNDNEFRDLLFNLGGITYENLPPGGKRDKIRELIGWTRRNGRYQQLVTLVQESRPHLQLK